MIRRFLRSPASLAVLAALLLSTGAISGQGQARAVSRTDKGLIWQFEREGRVGWLVGSLHMLTSDFYPLPTTMSEAFAGADVLMEEIDLDEASDPAFAVKTLAKAMYPAGTTLSSQLSPETLKLLPATLAKNGLTLEALQSFKPWMVAMTLQTLALQRIGFDPALGIDKHFDDAADKAGKPLIGLETAAEQIDFLDGLSPKTQDQMLRESVEETETELTEIKTIANAWRAGDAAAIEKLVLSSVKSAPEVYQSLLVDRNRRWVPKIEACVQTKRCFIVVGAAHLVGPDGLVTLLRQRGYKVEQR
jgi:uncharacterized protein